MLEEILRRFDDGLTGAMVHADSLPLSDLRTLALAFGETEKTTREALTEFLSQKAEEFRSYKSLIDGLDERVAAIANLKGAAQDAANNLNFDEVETLLARVDEVETTIAAETKEARASNALLRGRVEQAYDIYCAAADSFREIDIIQYANRRNAYRGNLYNHGLRYGGPGLTLAPDIIRPAIAALDHPEHQHNQSLLRCNLALALQYQASRTSGPDGTAMLAEAVAEYRAALETLSQDTHPEDWARNTQNLAGALQTQGSRTEGQEGAELLAEAVQTYRDALIVRTRENFPMAWGETTANLAMLMANWSTHDCCLNPRKKLEQALRYVEDALLVFDAKNTPLQFDKETRRRDQILAALEALPIP